MFNVMGVLGIIFVVFKIMEVGVVATWSWWLVLLPFYFGLAVVMAALVFGGSLFGIASIIDGIGRLVRRRRR